MSERLPSHEQRPSPREIERKFMIDLALVPSDAPIVNAQKLTQAYLRIEKDGTEERVRRIESIFGGDVTYLRTIKTAGGIIRGEQNFEIYEADYLCALSAGFVGNLITKDRITIATNGQEVIELDIYTGELDGLVVAEVEFSSENDRETLKIAHQFALPYWFGTEITEDSRFKNKNLARTPTLAIGAPEQTVSITPGPPTYVHRSS